MNRPFVKLFRLVSGAQILFRIDIEGGDYFGKCETWHPIENMFMTISCPFEDYESARQWLDARELKDGEEFYNSLIKLTISGDENLKDPTFLNWYDVFVDVMRNVHHWTGPIDMEAAKIAYDDKDSPIEYADTLYYTLTN